MKQGFDKGDGERVDVEAAIKNPKHPFRIAIVCETWLGPLRSGVHATPSVETFLHAAADRFGNSVLIKDSQAMATESFRQMMTELGIVLRVIGTRLGHDAQELHSYRHRHAKRFFRAHLRRLPPAIG